MRPIMFAGFLLAALGITLAADAAAHDLTLTVELPDAGDYLVTRTPLGQRIGFEGCGYRTEPGRPMLPTRTFLVGLPPDAGAVSVEVRLLGAVELPGVFRLAPAPEPVRIGREGIKSGSPNDGSHSARGMEGSDLSVGQYPLEPGRITGSGSLGEYAYVAVSICPCTYCPKSGSIVRYSAAEIRLTCTAGPGRGIQPAVAEVGKWNLRAEDRARSLLVNFDEIEDLYPHETGSTAAPLETHDYVIITTNDLSAAVTSSDFITWKTSLGYNVRIVLITDPEIAGQPGVDLAEQIRNFLRAYYTVWEIEYVLFVGDYATVPMRYCYPDPSNHTNTAGTPGGSGGEVPTDYYYADLSGPDAASWDSDGDGYHGEYGQDTPDFMPEVYVGRIPTNTSDWITYALDKTVAFEQDTGSWKSNALHAGAFYYFTHELSDTTPAMDAAKYLSYIEADIMSGWTVTHYSEQSGLEKSAYSWPALTAAAFTGSWRTGQHAVVNWGAHGWTNRVARKVWDWDDGDSIPEAAEISWPDIVSTSSSLDDDYPSIVTAASCLVGCPEPSAWDRMGLRMLCLPGWGPAVGVIASARSPYGSAYWPPGGTESIIYEFNDLMINDLEKVGQAFYDSKFYCNANYGWDHYAEYINMYTFNLWGDPSLTREGIDVAGVSPEPGDAQAPAAMALAVEPNPVRGSVTITYHLLSHSRPSLDVFDALGRKVRSITIQHAGPGSHITTWDGRDDEGTTLSSGMYWMRLSVPGRQEAVKVVRLR